MLNNHDCTQHVFCAQLLAYSDCTRHCVVHCVGCAITVQDTSTDGTVTMCSVTGDATTDVISGVSHLNGVTSKLDSHHGRCTLHWVLAPCAVTCALLIVKHCSSIEIHSYKLSALTRNQTGTTTAVAPFY